jgi:hypothetical protein
MWARIGVLLALLQHLEREMNIFLSRLIARETMTVEQIASLPESEKKKTLGQLAQAFHKQIPKMPPNALSSFIEDRNRFVHRLFREEGFDIKNPKDVSRIREFVDSLTDLSIGLDNAFYGLNKHLVGERHFDWKYGSFQWPTALKRRKAAKSRNAPLRKNKKRD